MLVTANNWLRGKLKPRVAIMLRQISDVPPTMVIDTLVRYCRCTRARNETISCQGTYFGRVK